MRPTPRAWFGGLALGGAALALFVLVTAAQRPEPTTRVLAGDTLYQVLPEDAIPALTESQRIPLAEAEAKGLAADDELFLGVVIGDAAVAYSTWLLEGHELVNDVVAGVPIAACW